MQSRTETTVKPALPHADRSVCRVVGVLLLLLAGYVLSYGPAAATRAHQILVGRWRYDGLPARGTRVFYRPLQMCKPLDTLLDRYFVWSHTWLYGPPPVPSPPPE